MDRNAWINRIRQACSDLHDSRQKTRKKAIEDVANLLESPNMIKHLNDDEDEWIRAFSAVKTVLYREMNRLEEEIRRKGKEGTRSSAMPCECRDLLHLVVKNANNNKGIINIDDFYRYLKDCATLPQFKKYCLESSVSIFDEYFLTKDSYWAELILEEIIEMKDFLKSLHVENSASKALRCYNTLLSKGSDYKLPAIIIKQEVEFVRSTRGGLHSSVRWLLEASSQLFLIFCQVCGGNYKQFCTTEGEDALWCFFRFYNPHDNLSMFKTHLMDNMIQQLDFHKGIETTPRWRDILLQMAKFIKSCIEINDNLVITHTNQGLQFNERLIKIALGCYEQSCELRVVAMDEENDRVEPEPKRAKKDATFIEIMDNIDEHFDGPWVLLFSYILEKYPALFTEQQFNKLLSCFANYIKDSKSNLTRGYVFKCLTALLTVEENLSSNNNEFIPKTSDWLLSYDAAIRTIGMNQIPNESHTILQQLLIKKHHILSAEDAAKFWNLYKSHTIEISENSLKTFHIFSTYHGLNDNSTEFKNSMIDFILKIDIAYDRRTFTHFSYPITAEVLENLTLKYYSNKTTQTQSAPIQNFESYNHLIQKCQDFISEVIQKSCSDQEKFLCCVHLYTCLAHFHINHSMNYEQLTETFTPLIKKTWEIMGIFFEDLSKHNAKKVTYTMNLLAEIFKIDEAMGVITKTIDMPFIESLVDAQCNLDSDSSINLEDPEVKLKLLIVKIFTTFATKADTVVQKNVQLMLYVFQDFDPCNEVDYQQAMIIFGGLNSNNCQLSEANVRPLLNLLKKICHHRYQEYNVCLDVLHILKTIYWHLIRMDDLTGVIKNDFLGIFKTLHQVRKDFGYKVELALVNCLDALLQAKKSLTWAKYNDELLIILLPYYLESDNFLVQEQSIKTISLIFEHVSNNSQIDRLKSEILKKILDKFDANFPHEDNDLLDNSRSIILRLLINIIISAKGTKFTKRAICELFVRGRKYEIGTHQTQKELSIIFKNHQIDVNSFVTIILQFWSRHYSILEFPIELISLQGAETDRRKFYLDNLSGIVPIVLKLDDEQTLEIICNEIGKSVTEVLEECYPKFFAYSIVEQTVQKNTSNIPNDTTSNFENLTFANLKVDEYIPPEKAKQLLMNAIDDVIIEIAKYVYDPVHFEQFFNYNICLVKPETTSITYDMFVTDVMDLLSKELASEVVHYVIEKKPMKLQQILLKLRYNIWEKQNAEDKLIEFYQYCIFVEYILQQNFSKNFVMFILRDVIYTNLNLIKYEEEVIQTLAMRFMSKFITLIIPKYTKQFSEFIIVTCSCLVPHAIVGNTDALKVLRCIIFSNDEHINNHLRYLDPLPEDNTHVQDLRHRHIKFRGKDNSLEEEIQLFLVGEQYKDSRTEGLKYLKEKLRQNAMGLKEIYLKLNEMRGILSKESILHKLITNLVVLVRSKDETESMEAVEVLGNLGASDLTTMVLKSEDVVQTKDSSSYLFSTKVLELLNNLLVEKNLEIANFASQALFAIMSTEEGRTIVKAEAVFASIRAVFIPFVSKGSGRDSLLSVTQQLLTETLCDEDLWCPEVRSHEEWIKELATRILQGFTHRIMKCLIPIVQKKASFAEEIFPFLINILMDTNAKVKNLVGVCIKTFFERHWNAATRINDGENHQADGNQHQYSSIVMNISSIRCILNAIHFVRLQRLCDKRGKYQELEFNLDYLQVAKAATYCSAHFSALMYAEKWYHATLSASTSKSSSYGLSPISLLDEIGEETSQLRFILTQAYKGIGDNYALFGGHLDSFLNENHSQSQMFNHNMEFQLLQRDMQLGASVASSFAATAAALMTSTLNNHALWNLALRTTKVQTDYSDATYECMWRLSQWDLPNIQTFDTSNYFEFNVYNLLNAINDNDKPVFDSWVKRTRLEVAQSLKCISLESCKTLYGPLSQLQRVQELQDIFTIAKQNGDLLGLLEDMKIKDEIQSDYRYWEPRIAQRIEAINLLRKRDNDAAKNSYVEMSLNFADISREHGNLQISKRILGNLINVDDSEINAKVRLLDARIGWELGPSPSISMLKKLLKSYNSPTRLRSSILKLCGEWMAATKSEFPQTILADYFLPCIDILNTLDANSADELKMLHDVYKTLAKFADEEYQHISKSIKSPEFERKVAAMNKMKNCALKLKSMKKPTNDIRRAIVTYERMTKIDEIDVKTKHAERDTFLKVAIKYYLYNMRYSQQVQTEIFRIFSLWLENKKNDAIIAEIEQNLMEIESYKILTILPQLVPHISTDKDRFSNCINFLIEKCAKEHPHHAIPLILSVANTNQDDNYSKENAKTACNESRIYGAQVLLKKLRSYDHLKSILEQNEEMAAAFIQLAYYKVKADKGEIVKIPRSYKIYNIRDFTSALVPTITLAFNLNLEYTNIVGVSKFKQEFEAVGGINAPKRLECLGTDGKTRVLLVKGQDDIRQDAVMQQVFLIMNELLRANKETVNFKIRTYKVVPLSKRSGVLEWVNNSMPIGQYLTEAHQHYYPRDKKLDRAKLEIKEAVSHGPLERLKTYLDVCEKIRPVFHKFFETNFLEPTVWYEKRRAYTQSVATSSMCGYILGIGDRHVQNILIDKSTAEVVHIDFGIAFEQGRILPTPETVPFRLTRDIVDGMGICGVEGTFRKTCEKTMEVLRRNAITIQTIVEVLLYDPLYDWSITPTQAYSKQLDEDSREDSQFFTSEDDSQVNVSAERALTRLKHKLLGIESGNNTSVETAVDRLIQQAREPSNLSKLFYGWQAFL